LNVHVTIPSGFQAIVAVLHNSPAWHTLAAATTAPGPKPGSAVDPLLTLLAELGFVLVLAIALGNAAQRLRLPAIVGQLLAGVILGPTVLGRVLHTPQTSLFPLSNPTVGVVRTDFLQVGLLVFIFLVGLEIDPTTVRKRLRTIVPSSLLGLTIPFAVGFACVKLFPGLWYSSRVHTPGAVAWVVGVALSISALPVIAAILKDLGLIRTEIGAIIISAAVIDDLCGWVAFAAIAAAFAGGHASVWQTTLIVFAAFAAALVLGRRIGLFADSWIARHADEVTLLLGVALSITLLLSAIMQKVGAHAFFGALIVGALLSGVRKDVFAPIEQFVRSFFAPLYFGAVGLSIDFAGNFDLKLVVVVFLIACLGKVAGVVAGARLAGSSMRESMAIAFGMNARGSVEILLATLALTAGLVDAHVFEAIVIMAVATSLLAGATIPRILNVERPADLVKSALPVLQRLDAEGRPVEEIEIGPRLTIGRDLANRMAVPDDELLGREHAVIRAVNSHFRIEDLGSVNGSLVWRTLHWQPVVLEDLHDGDIIVMGSTVCRISHGAPSGR
jgi:Kef-type K+ transport system membrane component KefB